MTEELRFDVVGIGNALVDVLAHHGDDFLERFGMTKSKMELIDADRAEELYAALGSGLEMSGGSAANTIAGVASFGGKAAFLGRVHDDDLGAAFAHDLRSLGVTFTSKPATEGPRTGRCLIVVTPDAHRTMNTYLGAASHFCTEDVDEEMVANAKVTFLEGYLFDRPESKEAYRAASDIAHGAGRKVALTLSDLFCVERHREDWLPLVRERVDILFANDAEAMALWQCDDVPTAVERAREFVEIGCITCGAEGSIVVSGDETYKIAAEPVEPVDTTGAGDLYAAGFLYGYTQGRPLPECGRLGSIAASAVLGHMGARPGLSLAQLIDVLER
ncbi:MAG TPA: adenosine kinase [Acidimicrobiales bacterium]